MRFSFRTGCELRLNDAPNNAMPFLMRGGGALLAVRRTHAPGSLNEGRDDQDLPITLWSTSPIVNRATPDFSDWPQARGICPSNIHSKYERR